MDLNVQWQVGTISSFNSMTITFAIGQQQASSRGPKLTGWLTWHEYASMLRVAINYFMFCYTTDNGQR